MTTDDIPDPPDPPDPVDGASACCVISAPLDEQQASELAAQLKALADPVRIRIVSMVATAPDGEVCACDFPAILDRSQPTVSHHLGQLVTAGILQRSQRGKWAWFRLETTRLDAIRAALGEDAARRPVTLDS